MQHPAKKKSPRHFHGRRLLVILLAVGITLSAAFVLLLPSIKAWFPAQKYASPTLESHQEVLASESQDSLSTITVVHAAGDQYTLEYAGKTLRLRQGSELVDISDAVADEMIEAATTIAISDTVTKDAAEVKEHLGEMGLETAQSKVTVTYTDGREVVIEVGGIVPDTSYYYYRWSGDQGVYMCDVGIGEVFAMTESRLLPVRQPVLVKSLIDQVRLKTGSQLLDIDFSTDSAGYTTGALTSPYPYPLSEDSASAVLTALENLRLGTLEGQVTEDNQAEYGFNDPLCVLYIHQKAGAYSDINEQGELVARQLPEQNLRFVFGRAEKEYFYTCEYEGSVYLVSRFLLETLLKGGADQWITRSPASMNGAELNAIVVQTGTGTLDIRIDRIERVLPNNQLETDSDGKVVYDAVATINGEPMAQEQVEALIDRLNAMTVSGDVPADWQPGNAVPRWRLMLTTAGGTVRTIAAYKLDAFSDALMVDGVTRHYAYVEALDIVLGELSMALKN